MPNANFTEFDWPGSNLSNRDLLRRAISPLLLLVLTHSLFATAEIRTRAFEATVTSANGSAAQLSSFTFSVTYDSSGTQYNYYYDGPDNTAFTDDDIIASLWGSPFYAANYGYDFFSDAVGFSLPEVPLPESALAYDRFRVSDGLQTNHRWVYGSGTAFYVAFELDSVGFTAALQEGDTVGTGSIDRSYSLPDCIACYDTAATFTFKEIGSPDNDSPILNHIGNKSINEGSLLQFFVSASDLDAEDQLTYSARNLPQGATFNITTGEFRWIPRYDQAGNYPNVELSVSDNGNPIGVDVETITITVGNVNRAPEFQTIGNFSTEEAKPLGFNVVAADPDGDPLHITVGSIPDGAYFDGQTFAWTPEFLQTGVYPITFTATDDGTPQSSSQISTVITVGQTQNPVALASYIVERIIAIQLSKPVENAYIASIKKAAIFIEAGRLPAARNQVSTLVKKIKSDSQKGRISTAYANELRNLAIELLGLITPH